MFRSEKNSRLDSELNTLPFIKTQIEIRDLEPIIKELSKDESFSYKSGRRWEV